MTIRRIISRFRQDERGAVLVLWGVALAVILGIVAMSFDFGRVAATQSELQSYADNVALAAAGELDGRNDAITRATAAAANLITDMQTFGAGGQALTSADYAIDFYSTLPGSDLASIAPGLTTNPVNAIYARVVVAPKTVPFTFGAAFFGLTGQMPAKNQVSAVAVAGFTQYACDVSPMMFCIPNPSFDASNPATVGDMIRLRSGGQGAAWGPGNFGFLEPSTLALDSIGNCAGVGGTGPMLRCVLGAAGSITQCYPQRGVNTEPGQKVGITNAALNTRFDMWSGAMKSEKNNPIYAPAPNVIKGIEPKSGGSCNWNNQQPTTDTLAIPRDDCFPGCAPYGNGNWSAGRTAYVAANYGGADPHLTATTRYEYYKAEIAAAGGGSSGTSILSGRSETGRPMCSSNQYPDPERRVIIVAGIDCAANPISGSASNVPVHQFVTMFITEPVVDNGSTNGLDIYAEIIGSAHSNGGSGGVAGVIHDVVQLYR
jgi:Flp pilus assembly protein TadG